MKIILKDYFVFPLILLAVFFDTDGSMYGRLLIDNESINFIGGFIGNLLWVFGLFLVFIGIAMIDMSVRLSNKDKLSLISRMGSPHPVVTSISQAFAIGTVIFLLEGGYWFTGLAWVLYAIGRHLLLDACNDVKKNAAVNTNA